MKATISKKIYSIPAVLVTASVMLFAPTPLTALARELPRGVYVDAVDLGGSDESEVRQRIDEYIEALSGQQITLEVDGSPVVTTAAKLGFKCSNQDEIMAEVQAVTRGNIIACYVKSKDLERQPLKLELKTVVDEERVLAFVEQQCSGLAAEPVNATIVLEEGEFKVTPGIRGKVIDIAATKQALDQAVSGGLEQPVTVTAVIAEQDPAVTDDALASIQDVLGTFSTDFSSSGAARSKNLQVGSAKINGTVLLPGETLSGYELMHPFTTANGYYTAAAYENGQVVDSVGGGVCQIATTLYNAALLAELEITQRQNHSMIVTYVDPSKDAAIAGTYKDIKVTNNYSTPIYVEAGTSGRTLSFTFYGKETRPANREIKYVSETLSVTDPGAPTTRVDSSLAPGARKQVQSAHRGRRSRLWKYVYVDGVETEKTLLHTDTYNASKAIVLVGPEVAPPVATPVETAPAETVPAETAAPVQGVNGGPGVTATTPAPQTETAPATEAAPAAPAETAGAVPAEPAAAPDQAPAAE